MVSPGAYWYVEKGLEVDQADLEESAAEFERHIYPRVSRVFGREWSPGVDNDPHLNIIHARLRGVLGYFSSADEHSRMVYPFSNQREAIYLNGAFAPPGSAAHSKVLAHELQHLIHWNGDASEETWVNEGLSELSASVAGYRPEQYPPVPGLAGSLPGPLAPGPPKRRLQLRRGLPVHALPGRALRPP